MSRTRRLLTSRQGANMGALNKESMCNATQDHDQNSNNNNNNTSKSCQNNDENNDASFLTATGTAFLSCVHACSGICWMYLWSPPLLQRSRLTSRLQFKKEMGCMKTLTAWVAWKSSASCAWRRSSKQCVWFVFFASSLLWGLWLHPSHTLWRPCSGPWPCCAWLFMSFFFAVLFCQAVHDHVMDAGAPALTEAEDMARIKYFGSLPDTMLSLFMSIAGGVSWEDVIFPLKAVHIVWVFCFLFYATWQQRKLWEALEACVKHLVPLSLEFKNERVEKVLKNAF